MGIMPETDNTPKPEENKQAPAPAEGELRAELDRVRGKNKTLKVVAAAFLVLFVIISAVGFFVYRRISATKAAMEEVFHAFPQPAAGYQPESRMLIAGQGVHGSSPMPASSLGLFSGQMPSGGGSAAASFDPELGDQVFKALNKYSDRPIVKAFMADLKKDPEMAAAFSADKKIDPLAFMAAIRDYKGMDKLALKYSTRPEFMKLMLEVMNDPDMKPLMNKMPAGMGMPPGMPQGRGVQVALPQERPVSRTEKAGEEASMTFDTSVISGPAKPAPLSSKKVPPPVDKDQ